MTTSHTVKIGQIQATADGRDGYLELPVLRSVNLSNLHEIESHQINRLLDTTSHVIRFTNGGHVCLSYNNSGQVMDFYGEAITAKADQEGNVTVGMYRPL